MKSQPNSANFAHEYTQKQSKFHMECPVPHQARSGPTPPPIVPTPSIMLAHCRDSTQLICQSSTTKNLTSMVYGANSSSSDVLI